jgi:hypothetical protein
VIAAHVENLMDSTMTWLNITESLSVLPTGLPQSLGKVWAGGDFNLLDIKNIGSTKDASWLIDFSTITWITRKLPRTNEIEGFLTPQAGKSTSYPHDHNPYGYWILNLE